MLRITHAVCRAHAIRMSVGWARCALGAAFDHSLESKRIEVDTSILKLDDQDMSELLWDCSSQLLLHKTCDDSVLP